MDEEANKLAHKWIEIDKNKDRKEEGRLIIDYGFSWGWAEGFEKFITKVRYSINTSLWFLKLENGSITDLT